MLNKCDGQSASVKDILPGAYGDYKYVRSLPIVLCWTSNDSVRITMKVVKLKCEENLETVKIKMKKSISEKVLVLSRGWESWSIMMTVQRYHQTISHLAERRAKMSLWGNKRSQSPEHCANTFIPDVWCAQSLRDCEAGPVQKSILTRTTERTGFFLSLLPWMNTWAGVHEQPKHRLYMLFFYHIANCEFLAIDDDR